MLLQFTASILAMIAVPGVVLWASPENTTLLLLLYVICATASFGYAMLLGVFCDLRAQFGLPLTVALAGLYGYMFCPAEYFCVGASFVILAGLGYCCGYFGPIKDQSYFTPAAIPLYPRSRLMNALLRDPL